MHLLPNSGLAHPILVFLLSEACPKAMKEVEGAQLIRKYYPIHQKPTEQQQQQAVRLDSTSRADYPYPLETSTTDLLRSCHLCTDQKNHTTKALDSAKMAS